MDNSAHLAQHPGHKLNSDTHVHYTIHELGVCNDDCTTKAARQPTRLYNWLLEPGRSSLARDEGRNMIMFGSHSNLGKMGM